MDKNKHQTWVHALLSAFDEDAFARVVLNDAVLDMPAGAISTMSHCVDIGPSGEIEIYVETGHFRWMASKARDGGLFLDVGAATGAICLPLACERPATEIICFEPATRARHLLTETVARNQLATIEILPIGISDAVGSASFLERPQDEAGDVPYLPEASSLMTLGLPQEDGKVTRIEVITLDAFAAQRGIVGREVTVKIDIEGYEVQALAGAHDFLAKNTVHLAIDIHQMPGQGHTTEAACREALSAHGYRFENLDHVLLCYPA
jgi:FkbM family methyltransferase